MGSWEVWRNLSAMACGPPTSALPNKIVFLIISFLLLGNTYIEFFSFKGAIVKTRLRNITFRHRPLQTSSQWSLVFKKQKNKKNFLVHGKFLVFIV